MAEIRRHERIVKRALRKSNIPDTFLIGRYSFSPYMACGHGCAYCDGRAERYWVEGDFDRDIVIRTNLVELLERELPKLRERATIVVGSGISDAYQPVERDEGLMRRAAELLASFDFPVTLLTKSSLVLRDLDLWEKVNRRGGFNLYISLGLSREKERRIFEPGASPIRDRLDALSAFRKAGCHTGIMALPLLPFIGDTEENLRALLGLAEEAVAEFFMPGGLTLRPGRQKELFLAVLRKHDPELADRCAELYGNNLASGNCISSYRAESQRRASRMAAANGFPEEIPHKLYRNRLPLYDEIYVLLFHMSLLYERRGSDTRRLESAVGRYREWLLERKKTFNRRRRMTQGDLEEELRFLIPNGGMASILRNDRLCEFMGKIVFGRRIFDYRRLELLPAEGKP